MAAVSRPHRPRAPGSVRAVILSLGLLCAPAGSAPVSAQVTDDPIGPFVVDARMAVPFFGQDTLAASAGLPSSSLPSRGLGLNLGGHGYFARLGFATLGAGAEILIARGRQVRDPAAPPEDPAEVRTSIFALAPAMSVSFGSRQGWSYLSGGLGWARLIVVAEPSPDPDAEATRTIHYGGGARWFAREHVAFSFDLRFYAIGARAATPSVPAGPAMTLFVLNVGASFK
jgi:hypothetical protein